MSERACRDCRLISEGTSCPNCKSRNVSDDFSGFVVIFDPEGSSIAKAMGISKKGKYAIRVR